MNVPPRSRDPEPFMVTRRALAAILAACAGLALAGAAIVRRIAPRADSAEVGSDDDQWRADGV